MDDKVEQPQRNEELYQYFKKFDELLPPPHQDKEKNTEGEIIKHTVLNKLTALGMLPQDEKLPREKVGKLQKAGLRELVRLYPGYKGFLLDSIKESRRALAKLRNEHQELLEQLEQEEE